MSQRKAQSTLSLQDGSMSFANVEPQREPPSIRSIHAALSAANTKKKKRLPWRMLLTLAFLALLAVLTQLENQNLNASSSRGGDDGATTTRYNKTPTGTKFKDKRKRQHARSSSLVVLRKLADPLMQRGPWDGSPIVIEKYKLVFFSMPKVAATTFKQLFRRMMGYSDWQKVTPEGNIPHNPTMSGLKYLYDYNVATADAILTSPEWTKAIFVREPKARLVSAYKDKALTQNGWYMKQHFCGITKGTPNGNAKKGLPPKCRDLAPYSKQITSDILPFEKFVKEFLRTSPDAHWEPQSKRVSNNVWDQMNFVGHFENLYQDAKRLLEQIGAWEEYGANGWEGGAIFATNTAKHKTSSSGASNSTLPRRETETYYTPELNSIFYDFYREDYEHPLMNFTKPPDFLNRRLDGENPPEGFQVQDSQR